jgi:hypothetical protein
MTQYIDDKVLLSFTHFFRDVTVLKHCAAIIMGGEEGGGVSMSPRGEVKKMLAGVRSHIFRQVTEPQLQL